MQCAWWCEVHVRTKLGGVGSDCVGLPYGRWAAGVAKTLGGEPPSPFPAPRDDAWDPLSPSLNSVARLTLASGPLPLSIAPGEDAHDPSSSSNSALRLRLSGTWPGTLCSVRIVSGTGVVCDVRAASARGVPSAASPAAAAKSAASMERVSTLLRRALAGSCCSAKRGLVALRASWPPAVDVPDEPAHTAPAAVHINHTLHHTSSAVCLTGRRRCNVAGAGL